MKHNRVLPFSFFQGLLPTVTLSFNESRPSSWYPTALNEDWAEAEASAGVTVRTLVVVDVAPVLPQLSELPPTLLALSLQVLLDSAFLPVRGLLHVSPEQRLLEELLPAHVAPEPTQKPHERCGPAPWRREANVHTLTCTARPRCATWRGSTSPSSSCNTSHTPDTGTASGPCVCSCAAAGLWLRRTSYHSWRMEQNRIRVRTHLSKSNSITFKGHFQFFLWSEPPLHIWTDLPMVEFLKVS